MNSVGDIYQHVIDDVIAKVASDFEHESVPESILHELKRLWEEKLSSSAVLPGTSMNQLMYPQHNFGDQNYPGMRSMPVNYMPPSFPMGGLHWKDGPPQNDGPLDDLEAETDHHIPSMVEQEQEDSDVESLGSDLDDDAEEPETEQLVLCQFEKVSRVKTKHKCQLKDGIMHLNGKDYLFSKATCEFEFYYN